jgi:hypothetical protein
MTDSARIICAVAMRVYEILGLWRAVEVVLSRPNRQ